MLLAKLLRAALALTSSHAFVQADYDQGRRSIVNINPVSKALAARQIEVPQSTSCTATLTVDHVVVSCTPVAGEFPGSICRGSTTSTLTGCDVTSTTTTTTNTNTITAECGGTVCANGACNLTPIGNIADPTQTAPSSTSPAVHNRNLPAYPSKPPTLTNTIINKLNKKSIKVRRDGAAASEWTENNWLVQWDKITPELDEVEHRVSWPGGDATAIHSSSRVRAFAKESFNMGVQGLFGCTAVILVSSRGVWMSHHFEVPTFVSLDYEMWVRDVQEGIFQGDLSSEYQGLNQYSYGPNALFTGTDDKLMAFIVTPIKADGDLSSNTQDGDVGTSQWEYVYEVSTIYNLLSNAYNIVPTVVLYERRPNGMSIEERNEKLRTTGLGKVIVAYTSSVDDSSDSCTSQTAGFEVWVYGNPKPLNGGAFTPFQSATWAAWPGQLVSPAIVSRDDANDTAGGVCPISFDSTTSGSSTSTSLNFSSTGTFSTSSTQSTSTTSTSPSHATSPNTSSRTTYKSCSITNVPEITSASTTVQRQTNYCNCDGQTGFSIQTVKQTKDDAISTTYICVLGPSSSMAVSSATNSVQAGRQSRTSKPDITSCSLARQTLTISSEISGKWTPTTTVNEYCTCNDDQQNVPFTATAVNGDKTVLCNAEYGGPTVAATTIKPPCPKETAPFTSGLCTLFLIETAKKFDRSGGELQYDLTYQAFDGKGVPADRPKPFLKTKNASFQENRTIDRCNIGFPHSIDVYVNIDSSSFKERSADSTNATNSVRVANLTNATNSTTGLDVNSLAADTYKDWGVWITIGTISWQTSANKHGGNSETLQGDGGRCNMGDWDGTKFSDHWARSMDCFWNC